MRAALGDTKTIKGNSTGLGGGAPAPYKTGRLKEVHGVIFSWGEEEWGVTPWLYRTW